MTQPNREPKSAEAAYEAAIAALEPFASHPAVDEPIDCEDTLMKRELRLYIGREHLRKARQARAQLVEARAGYEAALASPETAHLEPEGEVDALVAEAREAIRTLRDDAYEHNDTNDHRRKISLASAKAYAAVTRLASALSSRRALSREEAARIIDPGAYDEERITRADAIEHGKDPDRIMALYPLTTDAIKLALSKADAILSRVAPPSKPGEVVE